MRSCGGAMCIGLLKGSAFFPDLDPREGYG